MEDLSALKIDRSQHKRAGKRRRTNRPWLWPSIGLFLIAGVVWLFYRPITGFIDRIRLPSVRVVQVVESHPAAVGAVEGTAANGYIVAARRAALSADTPGRIVEINVTEGSVVNRNDVVARLYFKEYEAALQRAIADHEATAAELTRSQAALSGAKSGVTRIERQEQEAAAQVDEALAAEKLARLRFERTTKLHERGVASQDALDAAQADFDSQAARLQSARARLEAAKADVADSHHQQQVAEATVKAAEARQAVAAAAVAEARAKLDKTYVRAPFDGIVVLKDAEVGEVVSPNSQGGSNARGSVCTMVDFASLEVQADVPETSISSVVIGSPAQIFLDAFPDRVYRGKVSRIWPTANRQKATIEVRVAFLDRDKDLRPDMGVRVVFVPPGADTQTEMTKPKAQILVPIEAIVQLDGKTGVFVLERDLVHFQPVALGERRAGQVHVARGLTPGQRIVVDPPKDLHNGGRVQEAGK